MKSIGTALRLAGVALFALCASCTGSDAVTTPPVQESASPTPVAEAPTAVPTPLPTATPIAAPERTADERIADVLAALEANAIDGLIAWDVLDAAIRDDDVVAVTLCGWTGETIYDNVYTSLWDDSDDATPIEIGTTITSGECLNTHLVDTAFETIREFDLFRIDISADPASFASDERARRLLADETYPAIEAAMATRAEDGIIGIDTGFDGQLPASALAPILYRRVNDIETFEVASCRAVNQDAGLYRDGLLITRPREGSVNGPHAIDWYQLVRRGGRWELRDRDGVGFGDCYLNDDWPGEIVDWKPGEPWMQQ